LGYIWCWTLSVPGEGRDSPEAIQYRSSVWLLALALVVDAFTEVPYILGQYFLLPKLRVRLVNYLFELELR
jgi:hypothetical protein